MKQIPVKNQTGMQRSTSDVMIEGQDKLRLKAKIFEKAKMIC